MSYKIIFKNAYFICVFKPSLVLSVPSRFKDEDKREVLGTTLQKEMGQTLFPIHRLDFEVSGLVLFALTPEAQKASNRWFEKKEIIKTYEALTPFDSNPKENNLIWKNRIVRGKKRSFEAPHGDMAETHAHFVGKREVGPNVFAYWHLKPITGRSHQLRFHMAHYALPIVGDALYGSKMLWDKGGIALNSFSLNFSACPEREKFILPLEISIPSLF